MSFEFEISAHDLAGADFIVAVQDEIRRALYIQMKERGLTRKQLADILQCDKSEITRCLNGKTNLTARKIGQIVEAIGGEPEFKVRLHDAAKSNVVIVRRKNKSENKFDFVSLDSKRHVDAQRMTQPSPSWSVRSTPATESDRCLA